jgi:hypothetical protein
MSPLRYACIYAMWFFCGMLWMTNDTKKKLIFGAIVLSLGLIGSLF